MTNDIIFEPLQFRNLRVKNRIFRSNITGRFDNYDGSGTRARITGKSSSRSVVWALSCLRSFPSMFAVAFSPTMPGVENLMEPGLSSTGKSDYFHGLVCQAMTHSQIKEVVQAFAAGARRARAAGLDGVELHASHGYLFTQFLSSSINDRRDEYGGSLENRARFLLDVIDAIRKEVGRDYHLGVKINAIDFDNALFPWRRAGTTLDESIQVCKWIEAHGADHLHVSIGSIFPHPLLPPGGFPPDDLNWWYGIMGSSGTRSYLNYALFHFKTLRPLFLWAWNRTKQTHPIEGVSAEFARAIKNVVSIPVISTGGYQDARLIRKVISEGWCDAVSIARPLVANNDLPKIIKAGNDLPKRPCTFCNRCLINAIYNPLACYDQSRFDTREQMIAEAMSVFHPAEFE